MRTLTVALRTSLAALTLTAVAAQVIQITPANAATTRPVWAHRGGTHSGLVENTRANFRRSAVEGQLRWETDVRFSKTNYPYLLHDSTLHLFGCPGLRIAKVSGARMARCKAANGQTVTSLYQFTQDLVRYDARAWVELKTNPTKAQWKILDTRIRPVRTRIVVESFLPAALTAASKRGYRTALLTSSPVGRADLPAGTDWYAPEWTTVTAAKVTEMHRAKIGVVVWTPAKKNWGKVRAGVDELISNDAP